jgi:hypothetical protein
MDYINKINEDVSDKRVQIIYTYIPITHLNSFS